VALAPGTRLGPYEVIALIGAGGMGEVYKAQDARLGRSVALKLLSDDLNRGGLAVERFLREARLAAALNHPNICTIYDIGEDAGKHYIAMELLDGQTLRERLGTGSIDVATLLEIATGVADALDAAHRVGIVHRDIKPENVFLTSRGQSKVLDFGLAKNRTEMQSVDSTRQTDIASAHLTSPGTTMGTVAYMSPEQARGEDVDTRTDLFSLGAVIHEMATGSKAFPGQTNALIFEAILNRPPTGLQRAHPLVARLINRALEKDRTKRYQSAADIRSDLDRLTRDLAPRRAGVSTTGTPARPAHSRNRIESLAVLPLVNVSDDPDVEYLSEGIAESLINSFSQLGRLRVAQQPRSFRYRGADVDLQEAARDLHVQAVLTGRILLRGDTLVVRMSLVDVEKDAQFWGQQFTRKMSDIFVLQDEIADEALRALKLKLGSEPKKRAARHTKDTEAYHLYLKGRFYWSKRTPSNTQKALEFYQQAVEQDPTYALAYAGVADCYAHLGFSPYGTMRPKDAYPRAKAAAEKALVLDSSLGEAYASLGLWHFWYDWDWTASERAFRRSIELAPNSFGALTWYPVLLWAIGRPSEAIAEARRAVHSDPLSVNLTTMLGQVLYFSRHHEEALQVLNKALEMDSHFPTALLFVGFVHLATGNVDRAVPFFEESASIFPHHNFIGLKGYAYGHAGRRDEAGGVLEQLSKMARNSYVSPVSFSYIYQVLGQIEAWR
jgi:eukaryotic-like serine/threonine-protein kinase